MNDKFKHPGLRKLIDEQYSKRGISKREMFERSTLSTLQRIIEVGLGGKLEMAIKL